MCERGDIDSAKTYVVTHSHLAHYNGYQPHPLLIEFVSRNCGHCYRPAHRAIADLMIPERVRNFRDEVMADRIENVQSLLAEDSQLVQSEFTGGRGIAQAIHHWRSIPVGRLLLDSGANINALNTVGCAGESPLMMQLRFGTLEGVRFLLDRGANPNLGGLKHTPSASMAEALELLIRHDWDINERVDERTLIHHDTNHGHGGRVRLLLDHGANPDITDTSGRTALHLVSARGVGTETIRALVEDGANLYARDHEGRTPLDFAVSARSQAAFRTLSELGAQRSRIHG